MKLNVTPRHYMLLSQSQSDDEENGHLKSPKLSEEICKNADLPQNPKRTLKEDKLCDDPKASPMSPARSLAFILSLCLCFAFIGAFMWLVPCTPSIPTIDDVGDVIQGWNITLSNISYLTTDISLTNANSTSPIVLLGYSSNDNSSESHILGLQNIDGKILWELNLYSEPTSILCNEIDANNDGFLDCLVVGIGNLLTAIDVNTGSNIWYLHNHNSIQSAENIKMPVVLTDCDNDAVPDLVVSYTVSSAANITYLALISGRTGEVIGSLIPLYQCISSISAQFSLKWFNTTSLLFFCSDGKNGNLWLTQAERVCESALNPTEKINLKVVNRSKEPSFVQFATLSEVEAIFGMVINGSKVLVFKPNINGQLTIKWSQKLQKNLHTEYFWKIIGLGSYIKNKQAELLLLSSSNFNSQIIGLHMHDGRELWSKPFDRFVTLVSKLPNFFHNTDGLILKTVKSLNITQTQNSREIIDPFDERNITHSEETQDSTNKYNIFKEDYILFQVGELENKFEPLTKEISSVEIFQYCDAVSCNPNVFDRKQTAITTLSSGIVNMTVISMNASSPSTLHTHIKLLSFKHLKHPNCLHKLSS